LSYRDTEAFKLCYVTLHRQPNLVYHMKVPAAGGFVGLLTRDLLNYVFRT